MNHLFKSCLIAFFFISSSFFLISFKNFSNILSIGPVAGDIAFIGFDADSDGFAIVVLTETDGSSNSIDIHFTDNEWVENTVMEFSSGESDLTWTVNALITAGTVITFSDLNGSPAVTVGLLTGSMDLDEQDEQLYAVTGTLVSPTNFLAAISTGDVGNFVDDDNDSKIDGTQSGNIGSIDPSEDTNGLEVGSTAINFSGKTDSNTNSTEDKDLLAYFGSRNSETQLSDYLAVLNDISNWESNETVLTGTPSTTAFSLATTLTYTSGSWSNNPDALNVSGLNLVFDDDVTFTETYTAGTVTVNAGNTLTLNTNTLSAASLTLSGNAGLTVSSGLTLTGTLTVNTGSVDISGTTTIGDDIDFNNVAGTLTIASGTRLTLSDDVLNNANATFTISSGAEFVPAAGTTYGTSNIRAERTVSGSGYSFLCSPMASEAYVGGANEYYFDGSGAQPTGDAIDEGTYGWWVPTNSKPTVDGRGYTAYAESTRTFVGSPNAQTVNVNLVSTADRGPVDGGWNFIGNPYSHSLDLADFFTVNGGPAVLTGQAYFFDATAGGGTGAYVNTATGDIPTGQGFFVKTDNGGGGLLVTFTPAMIATDNTGTFYRENESLADFVALEVSQGKALRNLTFRFSKDYRESFDRTYDVYAFPMTGETSFSASASYQGAPYWELALPQLENDLNIPLSINAKIDQKVNIRIAESQGIPADAKMYLLNGNNGFEYEIGADPIEISANDVSNLSFKIIKGLGQTLNEMANITWENAEIQIQLLDKDVTASEIMIYDLNGRLYEHFEANKLTGNDQKFSIPFASYNQLFIVKITTDKGVISKKIYHQK